MSGDKNEKGVRGEGMFVMCKSCGIVFDSSLSESHAEKTGHSEFKPIEENRMGEEE